MAPTGAAVCAIELDPLITNNPDDYAHVAIPVRTTFDQLTSISLEVSFDTRVQHQARVGIALLGTISRSEEAIANAVERPHCGERQNDLPVRARR